MHGRTTLFLTAAPLICGTIVAGLFCSGSSIALRAAEANGAPDNAPLAVAISSLESQPAGTRQWRVRNISDKDIVAYSILAQCPEGSGSCRETYNAVLATARPPHDRLRPGESQERKFGSSPPTGATTHLSVDYVLFADGSEWGPDTKKQSLWIRGIIQGQRGTLARLKHVMETQGSGAVIEILKAPHP